jgi:tetratricopeptide (TPR) repeat protein
MRVMVAAAAVSAVLGVLTTLLAIGYVRQKELQEAAQRESIRANHAAEKARDAANRRARARDQAEELAGFIIEELRDELIQINRSDLLEAATAKAVAYFENLPPELVTAESQSKRASVLLTLSDARYQQGDHVGAIAAARRSVELWKELSNAAPGGESTIRYGRALGELGLYQNQSGDPEAAQQTYQVMLRLYENPPPTAKSDGWWDHGKAKAHMGLGEIARLREKYPEAREQYEKTIAHISAALSHQSNEISWISMLGRAHNNTGVAFMHEENLKAAEASLVRSLEPTRKLIRLEPKNRRWDRELGTTLLNIGALLHQQKDNSRAEPYLREALKVREGLVAWDSTNARLMRQLAHAWNRLALFQFDAGEAAAALASCRQALATYRRQIALLPGDERVLREMEDAARKYRVRLEGTGLAEAGLKLYDETHSFLETQRDGAASASTPPE